MRYKLTAIIIIVLFNVKPLLCQTISPSIRANLDKYQLSECLSTSSAKNTRTLINVWDSLSVDSSPIKILPIEVWEKLFEKQFEYYKYSEDNKIKTSLLFPLAYIYHSKAEFIKALPLLEYLHVNKTLLTTNRYKSVLTKMEEEYRALGNIERTIEIRQERIKNGFIKTFWELYKTVGLFELAINDFKNFETKPTVLDLPLIKYNNLLGELFFENNDIDSALHYFNMQLKFAKLLVRENKNTKKHSDSSLNYHLKFSDGNIGKCLFKKGRLDDAIPLLKNDISYSNHSIDDKLIKTYYLCLIYLNKKNFEKFNYYINSFDAVKKNRDEIRHEIKYHFLKAKYFELTHKFDSAYAFLIEYNKLKDSLFQKTNSDRASVLVSQFELTNRRIDLLNADKKITESNLKNTSYKNGILLLIIILIASSLIIILLIKLFRDKWIAQKMLKNANEILAQHNKEIKIQNENGQVLLSELHHRVKNNLQVFNSLLNLQKRRITNSETIASINAIQNRIFTMALAHQNLYLNEEFEFIQLNLYIDSIIEQVKKIYDCSEKDTSIINSVESLKVHYEKIITIGLIINEILTNYIKHVPQNGEYYIEFISKTTDNICSFIAKDNGPGYNEKNSSKNSLGLKVIKNLVTQLGGNYTLETKHGVMHLIEFNIK